MLSKSQKSSVTLLKTWGLFLGGFFLSAVGFGSLGENLIKGITLLELVVSIYKIVVTAFLNIIWTPLTWINIAMPPRAAIDFVLLLNIAFRFLVWPLKNVTRQYKIAVTIIASLSVFIMIYAVDWISSNYYWLAMMSLSISLLTLVGSFTILANQRLFADGLTIRFKNTFLTNKMTYVQPQQKLLLLNLFFWPFVWFNYYARTRESIFRRMTFSLIVVITIIALGLTIRAIDDYADTTLPTVERFGKAIDDCLSDIDKCFENQ